MRTNRVALRRAVFASVAVHIALAAGLLLILSLDDTRPDHTSGSKIDTRAGFAIVVSRDDIEPVDVAPTPKTSVEPTGGLQAPIVDAETSSGLRPPLARSVPPQSLPAEMLAVIRRPAPDPNVKPSGATLAPPIHGAMKAGQVVVYVLDCSGSMGEFDKLAIARAALTATLRQQPETVRFQVIAYNSAPRVLLPAGTTAPATAANIAAIEVKLESTRAAGRSNHTEAVRAATAFKPDAIVLLTDAHGLTATHFKSALAAAGKVIPVCIARVTPEGVAAPRELR